MKDWPDIIAEYKSEIEILTQHLQKVRAGERDTRYPQRVCLLEPEIVELRAAVCVMEEKAGKNAAGE